MSIKFFELFKIPSEEISMLALLLLALPMTGGDPAAATPEARLQRIHQQRRAVAQWLGQQRRAMQGDFNRAAMTTRLAFMASTVEARLPRSEAASRIGALADAMKLETGNFRSVLTELDRLQGDLRFELQSESETPEGFPGITPVGELMLLQYPAYRMAKTAIPSGSNRGFWKLFRHIESNDIAMTAPVQMDYKAGSSTMAFLYRTPNLGPTGQQKEVEVVDVAATTCLSIGHRGYPSPERWQQAKSRMRAWLQNQSQWRQSGDWRLMEYNSPWVPEEARFFEIQLPVQRVLSF
ncbi:MAG: hypothetical protein DWQ01_06260 [Planctomycetota bacterium]|nr:MAG: hypothetical protein DWQ01_06260 [Planctomycetota bacterium]